MKLVRAVVAGIVGGLVMALVLWAADLRHDDGIPWAMVLGTFVLRPPDRLAWMIGLTVHLCVSGALGVVYALGFEYLTHRASWLVGTIFGLVHALIAGVLLNWLPIVHPLVPEIWDAPGPLLVYAGAWPLTIFVAAHLAYGAAVGAAYGSVRSKD